MGAESSPAVVLSVWERFTDVLARTGFGIASGPSDWDIEGVDAASELSAQALAAEGAARARDAGGLDAVARAAPRDAGLAATILDVAADLDADAIVLGTRGLSGVKDAHEAVVVDGAEVAGVQPPVGEGLAVACSLRW